MFKTRLTEMFGVETPICMGGMTGVGYGDLVAAVAEAGALGFITAHMFPSGQALFDEIERTRTTSRSFRRSIPYPMTIIVRPLSRPGSRLSKRPAARPQITCRDSRTMA